MTDDKQDVVVEPTSDEGTEVTLETTDITTPQAGTEHVEAEKPGASLQKSSTVHDEPKEEAKPGTNERTPEEWNRLSSKAAKLEKEQAQARKTSGRSLDPSTVEILNERFHNNKDAYEKWRQEQIRSGGKDFGPHEAVYAGYTPPQPQGTQQGTQQVNNQGNVAQQQLQQSQQPQVTPQDIARIVDERVDDKKVLDQFYTEHPEFDARLAKDDDDYKARSVKTVALNNMAMQIQASSNVLGKSITREQALRRARLAFSQDAIKDAEETGITIGKAQAYAKGAGITGKTSGGTSKGNTKTVRFTKDQQEVYDRMMKSPSGTGAAKRFAEKHAK